MYDCVVVVCMWSVVVEDVIYVCVVVVCMWHVVVEGAMYVCFCISSVVVECVCIRLGQIGSQLQLLRGIQRYDGVRVIVTPLAFSIRFQLT